MKLAKINWKNSIYLLTVALPIILIDQITKEWALSLKDQPPVTVFESWWNFIYVENRGALWGLGNTFSETMRQVVFLGFSSLITLLVIYLLLAYADSRRMRTIYALITAGAIGNLYDRFFRSTVIDFIDWHIGDIYHWPTFNVADVAIVIAIALLAIEMLFLQPKKKQDNENKEKA